MFKPGELYWVKLLAGYRMVEIVSYDNKLLEFRWTSFGSNDESTECIGHRVTGSTHYKNFIESMIPLIEDDV